MTPTAVRANWQNSAIPRLQWTCMVRVKSLPIESRPANGSRRLWRTLAYGRNGRSLRLNSSSLIHKLMLIRQPRSDLAFSSVIGYQPLHSDCDRYSLRHTDQRQPARKRRLPFRPDQIQRSRTRS